MKKYIFIGILFISLVCFVVYFLIFTKNINDKSPEDLQEKLKQEALLYRKNLEQQILFYENDATPSDILQKLYSRKAYLCRCDRKYDEAYICYRKAFELAEKKHDKDYMAYAAWDMMWMAYLQNKPDIVLSLKKTYESIIIPRLNAGSMPAYFYYYWVGKAYLDKNDIEKASEYLTRGLKLFQGRAVTEYHSLLLSALSVIATKQHDLPKALEYLVKIADGLSRISFNYDNEEKKRFLEALKVFERSKPPYSPELSQLYQRVACLYRASDNKTKYQEYILKIIKAIEDAGIANTVIDREKMAELYLLLGNNVYPDGRKYYQKSLELLKGIKSEAAATTIFKIADEDYDESSEESLRLLLLSLKTLPEPDKKPLWVARAYHLIAFCYYKKQQWQKSADYSRKSLELLKKNDKIEYRCDWAYSCYYFLDAYYENKGILKERIVNAKEAVAFMKNNKASLILQTSAYGDLGKIYKIAEKYSEAEKAFRKVIAIIVKIPKSEKTVEYLKQEIDAFCHIGAIYVMQEEENKALITFDKAGKLLEKENFSPQYKVKAFKNLGDGYYFLNKNSLAENYYRKVIPILRSHTPQAYDLFWIYYRIGDMAFRQRKWDKARIDFEKSWEIAEQINIDMDSKIVLADKLAICLRYCRQFKKGLKFALFAYKEQKKKHGNNLQTGLYSTTLGTLYNGLNQEQEALKYLEEARKIFHEHGSDQPSLAQKISQYIQEIKSKKGN